MGENNKTAIDQAMDRAYALGHGAGFCEGVMHALRTINNVQPVPAEAVQQLQDTLEAHSGSGLA